MITVSLNGRIIAETDIEIAVFLLKLAIAEEVCVNCKKGNNGKCNWRERNPKQLYCKDTIKRIHASTLQP